MRYEQVYLEALAYELAPVVVTSTELESRIAPVYEVLRIAPGQLESLTGITERRWWNEGFSLSEGAIAAGRKALSKAGVEGSDVEALLYTGVCRENFEPATACAVAEGLGVTGAAYVYDLSNACLGVLNGIIDIANRIELGQIRVGMVVSCESAREINDIMIRKMLASPMTMANFTQTLATLTGGSGAVAVVLAHASVSRERRRRLIGAATQTAPEHHRLCRWGVAPDPATPNSVSQFMTTDSVSVLKHGVELGRRTWKAFLEMMECGPERINKVICHQVGNGHRTNILKELTIAPEKDFSTFSYLGNIGTVSLPLTAALAEQRHFLKAGDRTAFLGIGSGLNCMMLGWEW